MAGLAEFLREGGEDVVILWGERCLDADALRSLLAVAQRLGVADHEGAGLLEIPAGANGRGLREAGVVPGMGRPVIRPEASEAGRAAALRDIARPRPRATSPPCISSRPTRCAISPIARCGSRPCTAPAWSWRTPAF